MAAPKAKYLREGMMETFTPTSAKVAGDPVQLNANQRAGIAARDIAANVAGEAYVRGVFRVKKYTSQALAVGDLAYWDNTNARADKAGDWALGRVVAAAATADATVDVDLNRFHEDPTTVARILQIDYTAAEAIAGTVKKIYDAACPEKLRIIDFYIICKDANAGTAKLTDGTNDITNAITHGTADKAIVRAGTIDDAYWEIARGGTLQVVPATGGAAKCVAIAVPVP